MEIWPEVALGVVGLVNMITALRIDKGLSDLRAQIADERRKDSEKVREWVEEHFQRRLETPRPS